MEGEEPPTPAERARALLAWGIVHWNRKDLDRAGRAAEEARALALEAGLGHELGEASSLRALVAHARGTWREVFRQEFIESVVRTPDLASPVFDANLCFAEFSLYGPEGHEVVAPFARELVAIAEEAGSLMGRAIASLMLGEVELLSGRVPEAERELSRAADLNASAGRASGQSLALQRLAEAALARGRRWQAGRVLAKARGLAEKTDLVSHLRVRIVGALIEAAADPGRALAAVEKGERALARGSVCEPCSMGFSVSATVASARAGDATRARRHLDEAERIAGMWQGGPWVAAVWEARGALRLAEGEGGQAAAFFREAADGFAHARRPVDEARCRAAAAAL